tara:strand:- start:91 stop:252 length:162 start_codon:yes stop_codon:yes gene_type:complete
MIYQEGFLSTYALKLNCGSTVICAETSIYRGYVPCARRQAEDLNIWLAELKLH